MVTAGAGLAAGRRGFAVAAGLAADRLLGEPPAHWHPVAAYGRAMSRVERRWYTDERGRGIVYAIAGIALPVAATAAGAALIGRSRSKSGFYQVLPVTVATYITVAGKALGAAADDVARPLGDQDLPAARASLPALVGRDPAGLESAEIARAVVESVGENTVDAIVAPAFWAAIAGGPAAIGYRAINTLDAMVGHRSPRYARFGWASARADDVAGWLPARLTAVLVAAVRPLQAHRVWNAVRTQAPAHPSPNAGVAEAAFAAALGLRLGGTNRYGHRVEHRPPVGTGRPAEPRDIRRAQALSRDVTVALAVLCLAIGWIVGWRPASGGLGVAWRPASGGLGVAWRPASGGLGAAGPPGPVGGEGRAAPTSLPSSGRSA
jgi:adenosylcobinamide-phosphate synthase